MFSSIVKAHIMIVLLASFVGALSYYAFVDDVESVILYNLPTGEAFTVVT